MINIFGGSGLQPHDDPFVRKARELVGGGDDVVIDAATRTSVGKDGAWVLAWVWVSNDEAQMES